MTAASDPDKKQNKAPEKLSSEAIYRICAQLAQLFSAGITPVSALEIMQKDKDNREFQSVLAALYKDVCEGDTLSDAMKKTGAFTSYAVQLMLVGEQTGQLDTVTQALADFYEDEIDLRESIRSAITYPVVMVFMMFIVVVVLLRHVLPVFRQVYDELGTGSDGTAGVLMNIGDAVGRYYEVFLAIFGIFLVAFLYFYYTKSGQRNFRRFLAWFPGSRKLSESVAVSRFAQGMQLMQQSGLDTSLSLQLCEGIVGNETVAAKVRRCEEELQKGKTLAEAVIAANLLSDFYASMLNVAEESGSVDKVMGFIAAQYRDETTARINRAIAAIEPTLVIILSVVVGLILLGVILPMMGAMSSIG